MLFNERLRNALIPVLWKPSGSSTLPGKKVQLAFRLRYSRARKVQWSRIGSGRWQVFFEAAKNKYWIIYTNSAVCLETTVTVILENVPVKIQEQLELNNSTTKLQHIYKIQTALKTIFEVQFGNGSSKEQLVYNEKGKFLGRMVIEG